eukprot:TRINITY_DN4719_c0_g2_i14.p1 TRINITY_DN4719_c0_g2~~TRINITY_DN4719_c0_g2_i14.p1  ORF type:complete len:434 (-),score=60.00 TRINITY_DN4719_c0_g2_i14:111-1412(-)
MEACAPEDPGPLQLDLGKRDLLLAVAAVLAWCNDDELVSMWGAVLRDSPGWSETNVRRLVNRGKLESLLPKSAVMVMYQVASAYEQLIFSLALAIQHGSFDGDLHQSQCHNQTSQCHDTVSQCHDQVDQCQDKVSQCHDQGSPCCHEVSQCHLDQSELERQGLRIASDVARWATDHGQLVQKAPRRSLVAEFCCLESPLQKMEVAMQIDRNAAINAVQLLFKQPSGGSLGYLLLELRGNTLALRGLYVSPEHRGRGLCKRFLAMWVMVCFKLCLDPAANRIDKPLISLTLQALGFVPTNPKTPVEVGSQPGAAGEMVLWSANPTLSNIIDKSTLKKHHMVIATQEPEHHRTVYIGTGFTHPDLESLREKAELQGTVVYFSARLLALASTFLHKAQKELKQPNLATVSYTHLRAHETPEHLVCRLLLEKKKKKN